MISLLNYVLIVFLCLLYLLIKILYISLVRTLQLLDLLVKLLYLTFKYFGLCLVMFRNRYCVKQFISNVFHTLHVILCFRVDSCILTYDF